MDSVPVILFSISKYLRSRPLNRCVCVIFTAHMRKKKNLDNFSVSRTIFRGVEWNSKYELINVSIFIIQIDRAPVVRYWKYLLKFSTSAGGSFLLVYS